MTHQKDLVENKGWWPPPNSRLSSRPLSDQFWREVLAGIIKAKKAGTTPYSILTKMAKEWDIHISLIIEFLKATGLWGAFRGCTLDGGMAKKALDGATRGSGIWTAGTKLYAIGKHHFEKSVGDDNAPKKGTKLLGATMTRKRVNGHVALKLPVFWKNKRRFTETEEKNNDMNEEETLHALAEGTSGSAWMFYHHYNPDLLQAIQHVIAGDKLEHVINGLLEMKSLCDGDCKACKEGTCKTGKKLGCPHNTTGE